MANLTIAAAARLCHCDRRTLQRATYAGRLHLDAEHCLSREELLTAGYLIADTPQDTPLAAPQDTPQDTPRAASQGAPRETPQEEPQCRLPAAPQPSPQLPPYDPTKLVLGRLCPRGHAYGTTGKTLLRLPSRNCPVCTNAFKREQRAAKRLGSSDQGEHHPGLSTPGAANAATFTPPPP